MNAIVIYKTKYGSAKKYAEWICDELQCDIADAKNTKIEDLEKYDTIIYGGGLYAEIIAGASLITKNLDRLEGKKLIVYSVGITPLDCREYYDGLVLDKNFKGDSLSKIKVFNFLGKMIVSELSLVHKTAIKALGKLMSGKENPTEMEKLLAELCNADGDFSDKNAIYDLIKYAKGE